MRSPPSSCDDGLVDSSGELLEDQRCGRNITVIMSMTGLPTSSSASSRVCSL